MYFTCYPSLPWLRVSNYCIVIIFLFIYYYITLPPYITKSKTDSKTTPI